MSAGRSSRPERHHHVAALGVPGRCQRAAWPTCRALRSPRSAWADLSRDTSPRRSWPNELLGVAHWTTGCPSRSGAASVAPRNPAGSTATVQPRRFNRASSPAPVTCADTRAAAGRPMDHSAWLIGPAFVLRDIEGEVTDVCGSLSPCRPTTPCGTAIACETRLQDVLTPLLAARGPGRGDVACPVPNSSTSAG